jgi:alpha-glucosidase (family GH31 glycosyl hydrolase)
MHTRRHLALALLVLGGCRASDQELGQWFLSWDDETGALSVDHQGRRLLDLEEIAVGTGAVDIEYQTGSYRFSNATESMTRGAGLDVRSRKDTPLWLAEVLDGTGAAIATLSASQYGDGLLRLELSSMDGADDRVRFGFDCHGDDTFLGGGAYGLDVEHGGEAFDLWVSEPGIGRVEDDVEPDLWYLTGTRHSSSHPSPFLVRPEEPVGVAVDTASRVEVDLCASDPQRWTVLVVSGTVGLVVLFGLISLDVVERHAMLTGPPIVPPDWAFAPWNDAVKGAEEVARVAAVLREAGAPDSAIWTEDWKGEAEGAFGYKVADEWSVDRHLYPDVEDMAADLEADGFKWLAYFKPFFSEDTEVWAEAQDYTIKTADGDVYWMTGADLEDTTVIDPTDPDAVAWAQDRMVDALSLGFDGWMQDFGEWIPPDAVFHALDPVAQHNIHPSAWHRMAAEVVEGQDALIFTRSGWSGNGADAAVAWAGDQRTSFDTDDGYPTVISMGIGTSLAGAPFFTHDIGGYSSVGNAPSTKELWFRWCALGAFTPIMRTHHGRATDENWLFDRDEETLQHYVRYGQEHVALFPYLRGLADLAATEGTPLLLPPAMRYGGAWDRTDAWLLGEALLVAPVLEEGALGREVELPPDVDWYDYWTDAPATSGWFDADASQIPVFVAKGTVVPMLTSLPQTLVPGAGPHLTTLADVDHERTVRVFGPGGAFEEADGTRYAVSGTPTHRDKVEATLRSGVVEVGGAEIRIEGPRTRTYLIQVSP